VPVLGLIAWVSLISAGAYFSAGGGVDGLVKPMAAGTLGVIFTVVALYAIGALGGGTTPFVLTVTLLAFLIVMSSGIQLFSNIPAAFMAAAAYVGAGGKIDSSIVFVLVSWGAGLVLAFGIDNLSKAIAGSGRSASST